MADNDTPPMLSGAGLALWRKLHDELEFDVHDEALALELCRTIDLCERLQKRLDTDGLIVYG